MKLAKLRRDRNRVLLAASIAGVIAMAGSQAMIQGNALAAEGDTVHCYGINKCKGTGECGGKGHSCSGKNSCKGQGYIDLEKEECLKIEGGRLTFKK